MFSSEEKTKSSIIRKFEIKDRKQTSIERKTLFLHSGIYVLG